MQKSGEGSLSHEQLLEAVDIACKKAAEIRENYLLNI
jgi:exosome complex component RRP42